MWVRLPPALLQTDGIQVLAAAYLALNQRGEGSSPSGPTDGLCSLTIWQSRRVPLVYGARLHRPCRRSGFDSRWVLLATVPHAGSLHTHKTSVYGTDESWFDSSPHLFAQDHGGEVKRRRLRF